MLVVNGTFPANCGTVTIEPELPLQFRAFSSVRGVRLRWRAGNLADSLFECLIEADSGCFVGATMVLPGGKSLHKVPDGYRHSEAFEGLPKVDVAGTNQPVVTSHRDLFRYMGECEFYVLFDATLSPDTRYQCGRFAVFSAAGLICGVAVTSLSNEERDLLAGLKDSE